MIHTRNILVQLVMNIAAAIVDDIPACNEGAFLFYLRCVYIERKNLIAANIIFFDYSSKSSHYTVYCALQKK
jgi:hypothetical protein